MDKRAFEAFYRENLDRIYRYVFFRVGRNQAVAEDLVAEIFMKALKNFESFDPAVSKSAWIYRIAHNHLANYYRDQKKDVDLEDVALTLEGTHGGREMEKREGELVLGKALAQLNLDERRLVTMKHIEGYSYAEMGEILGRTAAALKVATHRATKKLKHLCSGLRDN